MIRLGGGRRKVAQGLVLSLHLLAAHRLRTVLSVSGLLLGVATAIVMDAVGRGAERRVIERVQAMGSDLLVVSPAPAPFIAGRPRQVATVTTLTVRDAASLLEESSFAAAVAPAVNGSLVARWEGRNTTTRVTGTTLEGLRIRRFVAQTGRVFDEGEERERRRVALIGPSVRRNLFGTLDPIGREIRIGAVPFDVIGVLRARGTDMGGADLDNVIVVPLQTAMRRLLNIPYLHTIFVQARSSRHLESLEGEVREILDRTHRVRSGVAEPFVFQNQAELLRTERGTALEMNRLVVGVTLLALLLGGVGIVAVMLMSVRERIREIGLRRALGARRRDIELQFVLESTLLATAGATAGVALGTVAAVIASFLGPWDLLLSWRVATLTPLCSMVLGLAVGVIPATRAAGLEPIEALRTK